MKRLLLTTVVCTLMSAATMADNSVTLTKSGNSVTMANEKVKIVIGTNGRVSSMTYKNGSNLLASSGIYFDYTADKNAALSPSTVEIIRQDSDYAEVLYSNTSDALRFQQGFIMRKGVNGVYTYIIANGTSSSSSVKLKEARVCTRLSSSFLNGYVDDRMNGKIPSNTEMATAEKTENTVTDATYYLADSTIYTKYNWAQYVVKDSVHGLMNNTTGVWNIPCSHEWLNGGPMRQELTVHATSKSPITIQMIQGEHMGASAQYYNDGEQKLYGPFLIYVNYGTKEDMIADAKKMASQQQQEWPFQWFSNDLYPLDRCTVNGTLNVTTGQGSDSIQVLLAEPDTDPYLQGKSYMFWATTDKDGNFSIKNVRKGSYTLYAYALKGDNTDELQVADINVSDETTELGTLNWTPTMYANKLWQIGENNRLSDGFKYSDTLRAYGLWSLPPATLNYIVGQSDPANDWYYAQTKNGTWTVTFNLDDTYTGNAYLTASCAGSANKPKVAVAVNGSTKTTWSFSNNDAAIYRSALLSGRHSVQTCTFAASLLKKGNNTVSFTMSGISKNGGVMWDCIKLEAGDKYVPAGISNIKTVTDKVTVYTIGGTKIGTFNSIGEAPLSKGIYIYRQGSKSGKIQL